MTVLRVGVEDETLLDGFISDGVDLQHQQIATGIDARMKITHVCKNGDQG